MKRGKTEEEEGGGGASVEWTDKEDDTCVEPLGTVEEIGNGG